MQIKWFMTITELSKLTNKSRPSMYKYVENYKIGNYDEIPYSIITLFNMLENNCTRSEIINYCNNKFGDYKDENIKEIILILNQNKDIINFEKIKKLIQEEIILCQKK